MSGLRIELSEEQEALIRRHAEADYPHECCGVLIGKVVDEQTIVTDVYRIENQREDNRERRFLISPKDYQQAEMRAEELGGAVVGFYHSHPDHPAIPSEFDREHALPLISYVIVSVRKGKSAEMRSWQLELSREAYEEEKIFVDHPYNL